MSKIKWILYSNSWKEYEFEVIEDDITITSDIEWAELDLVWEELDELISLS